MNTDSGAVHPRHQLVFTLTLEDYIGANRLHWRASYKRPRTYRTWLWVMLFYGVLFLAIGQSFRPHDIAVAAIVAVAGGIGAMIVCGLIGLLALPGRSRRLFAQQKTLHQEQRVSIEEDVIRFEGANFHLTHPWSDFPRWNESSRFILLYISDNAFHILPARALTVDARASTRQALEKAGVRKDR